MYKLKDVATPKKLLETVNDLGVRSNPNILINGDFAINQRGAASYTTTGTLYTCDRLVHYGANAYTLTPITTGGVIINASGGIADFAQIIENGVTKYGGKAMTLSVSVGGVIYSFSGTPIKGTLSSFSSTFPNGLFSLEWTSTDIFKAWFRVYSGATVTINWWKLELGSIATPFVPPLTAEELPKCQRYYWKINSASSFANIASGFFRDTTNYRALFYTPTVMRTSPTVAINGTLNILNASLISTTGYTLQSYQGNIVVVQIAASSAQTAGTYAVVSLDNGSVTFDAEIY